MSRLSQPHKFMQFFFFLPWQEKKTNYKEINVSISQIVNNNNNNNNAADRLVRAKMSLSYHCSTTDPTA